MNYNGYALTRPARKYFIGAIQLPLEPSLSLLKKSIDYTRKSSTSICISQASRESTK
jgi:hypothetical protein